MCDRYVNLFTDGGVRGNGKETSIGAYGVYMEYIVNGEVLTSKEIGEAEVNTTNNIQELKGAIEGLKAIKNKNIKVNMYLDSQYVKNGLESWISNWKRNNWKTANKKDVKNKELWIELDKLRSEFNNLELHWVKGHNGNHGNEMADDICNRKMDELLEKLS